MTDSARPTDAIGPAIPGRAVGALIGLLSVAAFLAFAQLAAIVGGRSSAPVLAIGQSFIRRTPTSLKQFAIDTFGTNDKLVLITGIFVVIGIVAVVVGVLAMRRPWIGTAGIVALGVIAGLSAHARADAGRAAPLPAIVGAAVALMAFRQLLRTATPRLPRRSLESFAAEATGAAQPVAARLRQTDRRKFLQTGIGVAASATLAGIAGFVGTRSAAKAVASRDEAAAALPTPVATTPTQVATGLANAPVDLAVPGVQPFLTRNAEFYRIDTALSVPQIDANTWSLRIHGMVDKELRLSYADLKARPLIERDVTIACVSNPVGGPYIGNARWTGTLLAPILREAGVHPEATQIVATSADGFTCGTPTEVVLDGRDAMLAIAMNGQPLAFEHGFPVRVIVPGLYGYVSATKWITDMQLTTLDYQAYWIVRGYAQQAPIKTQSRIDVPHAGMQAKAGPVTIAGVAWAQHRGVAKVEVGIDANPWQEAELAGEDTIDTWRQWKYSWAATPGQHTIRVRATDKTGATQTADVADEFPNGATGYHHVTVKIA